MKKLEIGKLHEDLEGAKRIGSFASFFSSVRINKALEDLLSDLELLVGSGVNRNMKDEDASRIANSLERIAKGLDHLNELLQRRASRASFPTWAWAVGIVAVGAFIWGVLKTGNGIH